MQLKKIMASLGVLICLFVNSNAVAYAETVVPLADDGISLTYEIAGTLTSTLNISSKTAYCTSWTDGTDAVSITVTQTLQKHWGLWIWNNVEGAEWTRTENRNSIRLSNSISGLGKGTYRVKSVFVLTDIAGKSETITIYSDEQNLP